MLDAEQVLRNMDHRVACGCDKKTGDGSGILTALPHEFFTRVVKYYTDKYGADSKEFKACRNGATFEPHVAELIFEQMLKEQPRVKVWRNCRYSSVLPEVDRAASGNRQTFTMARTQK